MCHEQIMIEPEHCEDNKKAKWQSLLNNELVDIVDELGSQNGEIG